MPDRCFEAYLRDVVSVLKSQLVNGINRCMEIAIGVPCRLHPKTGEWDQVSVGPVTGEKWVGYLGAMDIEAGDFLVERTPVDVLAFEAASGAFEIQVLQPDLWETQMQICIGNGETFEFAMVTGVEDSTIYLDSALSFDHAAADEVSGALVYEVLNAMDEAGAGHHLRLELLKRQGPV